jgi:glycyl-tRNA synthetase beta chain
MVGHQRYFPIEDESGNLLNHFITVANTKAKDLHVVAQGNARVLNARLADAKFFFEQDKKKSLEARLPDLKGIIFLKEVGSYYEKALRLQKLAEQIAHWIAPDDSTLKKHASRAGLLAKTDLTTGMVGEFPSLQGVMGGIYAKTSGESEEVAVAIEEHYLPRSAKDIEENVVPQSLAGACVAIADRIDTVTACLGVGLKPKGDKDPYGLRRAVYGILAIIREKQLKINLKELINSAIEQLKEKTTTDTKQLQEELWNYFIDRIWNQIIENGMSGDVANAVTRSNAEDYLDFFARAKALYTFKNEIEGFDDLATSFRRVGNILENLHKEEVDESLLDHDSERKLYRAFTEIKNKFEKLAKEHKYLEALYVLAELRPMVDKFFDDVLVNDPNDEKRRVNRHSLLYQIHRLFLNVADFSAISK